MSGREAGTQATWSVLGELIGNCEASATYMYLLISTDPALTFTYIERQIDSHDNGNKNL